MDDWVHKALQRWPNVPALFGWLSLDRRGRWLIQHEVITHPRIIATIHRNYAADDFGRWFFQNGPQRGYMQLETTPLVLFVSEDSASLVTHNELLVSRVNAAYLDEHGSLVLMTEHGPGELIGSDLAWALERMSHRGAALDENLLAELLALPSGTLTDAELSLPSGKTMLQRLDFAAMPAALGFDRDPKPGEGEKVATRTMD